jgi:uncharacterized NAD(P)/FAD-binding protein YdhS
VLGKILRTNSRKGHFRQRPSHLLRRDEVAAVGEVSPCVLTTYGRQCSTHSLVQRLLGETLKRRAVWALGMIFLTDSTIFSLKSNEYALMLSRCPAHRHGNLL